jgi:hypothetical protein
MVPERWSHSPRDSVKATGSVVFCRPSNHNSPSNPGIDFDQINCRSAAVTASSYGAGNADGPTAGCYMQNPTQKAFAELQKGWAELYRDFTEAVARPHCQLSVDPFAARPVRGADDHFFPTTRGDATPPSFGHLSGWFDILRVRDGVELVDERYVALTEPNCPRLSIHATLSSNRREMNRSYFRVLT